MHGLDEPLVTFAGNAVMYQEPGETQTKPLTRRFAILNCLGSMQVDSGVMAIRVYALGTQIYKAQDEFAINEEDLAMLQQAVEQNRPGYLPVVQGQLLQYLDSANKR